MATIYGTNGNDRNDLGGQDLIGTAGADSIFGLAGNDLLEGLGGNDYLDGGTGINTIRAGTGFDYVRTDGVSGGFFDGGADNDIIEFTTAQAGSFDLAAGWGTFAANPAQGRFSVINFENIYTGAGWDRIWGTDAANEIRSGSGWDEVIARGGNDTVRAGAGDDYVDGGNGNDWIDGAEGWDELYGGAGNDMIYGGSGVDLLWGGTGADIMDGGFGSDTIDGGESGFDTASFGTLTGLNFGLTVDMGAQKATYGVNGITETDWLFRIDKVIGSSIADKMIAGATTEFDGNGGHDNILSGSGANRLYGNIGNDWISYERSSAAVNVNLTNQTASGGWAQGDTISSFENARGSAYADVLRGSNGENMLDGGAGNDVLYGEGGADRIWGGAGNDEIRGGGGADRFMFASTGDSPWSGGGDAIRDYQDGIDKIDLSGIDANVHAAGNNAFSNVFLSATPYSNPAFTAGTIAYAHQSDGRTLVMVNTSDNTVNGFDQPEMAFFVNGHVALQLGDFIL